jgi:hypothetical protein
MVCCDVTAFDKTISLDAVSFGMVLQFKPPAFDFDCCTYSRFQGSYNYLEPKSYSSYPQVHIASFSSTIVARRKK